MPTHCLPSLVALLALLAPPPAPGGRAEDYARAASMRERVRDTVLNERIEPIWLDGDTVVFRVDLDVDRWRFVRIDARTGERADAFDHARVATQLGGDADRLPITLLPDEEGRLLARVEGRDGLVTIDRATGAVAPIAGAEDPRELPQVRDRRSRDLGRDTEIEFVNEASVPIVASWLDRGGGERAYHTLQPGERRRQHTFAGHVWRLHTEDGQTLGVFRARRTPAVARVDDESEPLAAPAPPDEPAPAADRPETFVRDHDLWVRGRADEEPVRLTSDGTAEDFYTGRVTWSPDGTKLVVVRTTPAQEHLVHFVDTAPDDRVQPRLVTHDYPKPGDRIARPRPVLADVATGDVTAIDDALFPTPWSISRIRWTPDGTGFFFLYNERGHRIMRLLRVDAATGAVRAVIDERPETFFDYASKLHLTYLPATNEAIWMSERSGWNHLHLVDLDTGATRAITDGPWVVRGVESVDAEARTIHFRAMGVHPDQDPYHVHHGRVGFDGSAPVWLTAGNGTHELTFSADGRHYVDTWSRVDHPPVHELRRTADGSMVAEMARADWSPLRATGWRPPERFVAKGRDGVTDIHGVIFTPSTFDPGRRYPVIENIYAGPHGHFVPKRFAAWHGSREVSELGFVVVRIDGMGTNWRSKAFHDVAWRNLADSGFPDRIAWIRAAASTRPWMDLDRVGIYGGSAGGQSALRALLAHGDFYRAAVADCGCHDNRMDKIWWNELWMGWPIGDHYAEQSNVTQAHRLEGDLLLIVGELDRNVDPASTMQVADALIAADKDFDLIVMTGVGHGAAETPYGKRRRQDFFVRKLLGVEPRR